VTPDLTTLGKVIGGGLPVGAYGGRRDIMQMVAPAGPVYQAGTLAGNPLAMSAGIVTLEILRDPAVWERLERAGARLVSGLEAAARAAGVPLQCARVGTMFGFFFTDAPVTDWESAKRSDTRRFGSFHSAMLERGVYFAPSQFEAAFLSIAHGDAEIDATIAASAEAITGLRE
jgi:glutamate-1-semialdehyde 2,1-aminomutase